MTQIFNDKVHDVLLGMEQDGFIELHEDGTFDAIDDTDRGWLAEMQSRFEKAGLSLTDLTTN